MTEDKGNDEVLAEQTGNRTSQLVQGLVVGHHNIVYQQFNGETRYLTTTALPPNLRGTVDELAATHPAHAARLHDQLEAAGVEGLETAVRDGAPWIDCECLPAVQAIAEILTEHLKFDGAEQAWLLAAGCPGADPPRMIARAAGCSFHLHDGAYVELIERASSLEANHPSVVMASLLAESDPQRSLQRLDGVQPRTPRDRASVAASKARALAVLDRLPEARACLDVALLNDPSALHVRELAHVLPFLDARSRFTRGEDVATPEFRKANEAARQVRQDLILRGRYAEAAKTFVRIAQGYVLTHDERAGREFLRDDLTNEERAALDEETAVDLARVAFQLREPEIGQALLRDDYASDGARLVRAERAAFFGSKENARKLAETIDDLVVQADQPIREAAAFLRLELAAENADVQWSPSAELTLRSAEEHDALALLQARHLSIQGKEAEAERLLEASVTNPHARRLLALHAIKSGDLAKARQIIESMAPRNQTDIDRLEIARLGLALGEHERARRDLARVWASSQADLEARSGSFRNAVQLELHLEDYSEAVRISREWFASGLDRTEAGWQVAYALKQQALHDEAAAFVQSHALSPTNEDEASILGELIFHTQSGRDRVLALLAVVEEFGRDVEFLESAIIGATLELPDTEPLPDDVKERVQFTFDTFATRFPESTRMQSIDADNIVAFIKQQGEAHYEAGRAALEAVIEGRVPVAILAAALGRDVGRIWGRLRALPMQFDEVKGDGPQDLAAACAAVGSGAVLDQGALFVLGGLGTTVTSAALGALLNPALPTAVLHDVQRGSVALGRPGEPRREVAYDPEAGGLQMMIWSQEDQEREERREQGTLELARRLSVEPDTDLGCPTEFDELIAEQQEGGSDAIRSVLAVLSVARRRGVAVYSDDRVVRGLARSAGIPAFGTVALLRALRESDRLDPTSYWVARSRLVASGAQTLSLGRHDVVVPPEVSGRLWDV